jgi:hypothetical protein
MLKIEKKNKKYFLLSAIKVFLRNYFIFEKLKQCLKLTKYKEFLIALFANNF